MAAAKKPLKRAKAAPVPAVAEPAKPAKHPGGRPTLYSPAVGREICRLVEDIGYLAVAAESVGIHRHSAYNWQRRGLDGDPEFAEFAQELAMARSKWVISKLKAVEDPRWLLERLDPTQFGPKVEPPVSVNVAVAVPLTREQALARLRELASEDPNIAGLLVEHGG